MPWDGSDPRKRASNRRAQRKRIHAHGQPRDQREQGRSLLTTADGQDIYEKTAWLKGQREAIRLLAEMGALVSREFVSQRLANVGRVIRDALELVPDRVADELAMRESAVIRTRLRAEINSALSALANALELGQNAVDAKRAMRKGNRGIRRSRPVEIPSPTL